MEIFTTCKIEVIEQIVIKFVVIDYVDDRNVSPNFVKSVHGGLQTGEM